MSTRAVSAVAVMSEFGPARGFAIGLLTRVTAGRGTREYLQRIDATLLPYRGRFLVHGGATEVVEGPSAGDVIVIEFPSIDQAQGWYRSDAYQAIVSLRTDNADGTVMLIEGVQGGHLAPDVLPGRRDGLLLFESVTADVHVAAESSRQRDGERHGDTAAVRVLHGGL